MSMAAAVVQDDMESEFGAAVEDTAEEMIREAVGKALVANHLPAILKPRPRREGVDDPATFGFPPTLPIELVLRESPRNEILEAYHIGPAEWEALRTNPVFQKALQDAVEKMQREGFSFRVKAQMQAEALLETSWALIHSNTTPASVKSDLIKNTIKVAGLEPKEAATNINPLQININLG
jgi:hypothetical protein